MEGLPWVKAFIFNHILSRSERACGHPGAKVDIRPAVEFDRGDHRDRRTNGFFILGKEMNGKGMKM
jgi:hypothetical protein